MLLDGNGWAEKSDKSLSRTVIPMMSIAAALIAVCPQQFQ